MGSYFGDFMSVEKAFFDKLSLLRKPIKDLKLFPHGGLSLEKTAAEMVDFFNWFNTASVSLIDSEGKFAGVFTAKDLMLHLSLVEEGAMKTPVGKLMREKISTLTLEDSIGAASLLMIKEGTRHVPIVTDNNTPYAILSMRDIHNRFVLDLGEEALKEFQKS